METSPLASSVSNCFTELVGYVFFLKRTCARAQPEFGQVRSKVDALIEESAVRMRSWQLDPRDYDDARFAVFAWADETILNMPWSHREDWRRSLLQTTYYHTTSAGEEFFERLNRLRADQQAVREVYVTCLGLGFRGRYHAEGDEFLLTQLKKANLKSVSDTVRAPGAYAEAPLFPSARTTGLTGQARAAKEKVWTLPRIVLAAGPPAFALLLFVVYTFVLNGVVDNLLTHLGSGRG